MCKLSEKVALEIIMIMYMFVLLLFSTSMLECMMTSSAYHPDAPDVDRILFQHIPIISTQQIRYVPDETRMLFSKSTLQPVLSEIMESKIKTKNRLKSILEQYSDEHTSLTKSIENIAAIKGWILSCWVWLFLPCICHNICHSILDTGFQWLIERKMQLLGILQKQDVFLKGAYNLCEKSLSVVEKVQTFTESYAASMLVFKEQKVRNPEDPKQENYIPIPDDVLACLSRSVITLENTMKAVPEDKIALSGREFAYLAQHYNEKMVRLMPSDNEMKVYLNILIGASDKYNSEGHCDYTGKKEVLPISYYSFNGMGISHQNFSKEDMFLLPYIKKCVRNAAAYDGYGNRDVFLEDPRYDKKIHGPYGAVFLLSPHEQGYNNTATGKNSTWLRRESRKENLWDTCNRYLNWKNGTKGKNYLSSSFSE